MALTQRARWRRSAAALALAVVAAACGADDGDDDAEPEEPGVSGVEDEGTPVEGGSVTYALEAETSGGYCLPESQLAISGMQVAKTIYDTLTGPNADGEIVPFLAESVEPNETYDQWTITLREGVRFHDGTPLDAQVVANNLDAYRGAYEGRSPLLFVFVFEPIDSVEVVDPMTVRVDMKEPWAAFPWTLYGDGRIGILAQAQLDDSETCDRNLIGTGPFVFEEWRVNQSLTATKNPDYWLTDAEGNALPYLDRIEYRPVIEGAQRVNLLQSGEVQASHEDESIQIDALRELGDDINLIESNEFGEVDYLMLNAAEGRVFNSRTARLAAAHAIDRERVRNVRDLGIPELANGPFAPGNAGYVEDPGFPEYDLERAQELVAQYERESGRELRIVLSNTTDPDTVATGDLVAEMLEEAGIQVDRDQFEQAQLINTALGGQFDMLQWRNHPGGHPDRQYIWWYTGSPVNFGRIADPEIDRLLDEGRAASDPEEVERIYQELTVRFAEQVWNIWLTTTTWAVGTAPNVHGILGPNLPDGSEPFTGLATGHPVSGMWVAE